MENIQQALVRYWGYNDFLPLQRKAMECVGRSADSIVVLPTGGGKSLCYQAPAVVLPGLTVVVSPLISLMKDQVDALMKDQVDALIECGVSAARIDSSLAAHEQQRVFEALHNKQLKLLYLSPERLVSDGFVEVLKKTGLSFIAIDEAHCRSPLCQHVGPRLSAGVPSTGFVEAGFSQCHNWRLYRHGYRACAWRYRRATASRKSRNADRIVRQAQSRLQNPQANEQGQSGPCRARSA